jgi:2-oxoglutarate ferredoxin oxidoreductase subunit delta
MIKINKKWCKGCGLCIYRCPQQALEKSNTFNSKGFHLPQLKKENTCNQCRTCELICPDLAITVIPEPTKNEKTEHNNE